VSSAPAGPPMPARALAVFLALLIGGGVVWYLVAGPVGSAGEPARTVVIRPQTGTLQISAALKEAGVIRSRVLFHVVALGRGTHRRLLPGEYEFDARPSLLEVVRRLEEGRGLIHQVTVPEGLATEQVAQLLADRALIDRERFLRLVVDPRMVERHQVEGRSLEGYLFPDTYRVVRGEREEAIIERMVRRFHEQFGPEERARAEQLEMSVLEVVTLASLIEREARVPGERPLISAVFHNRLRRGMPLQSDPTVLYGLSRFSGRLTRADLRTRSPYNTYLYPGLPPGPIASPGRASILAALYPAASGYLYFVSRNDGTHAFSKTLREHEAKVRRYQIEGGG
jgi:UPF0755 protein